VEEPGIIDREHFAHQGVPVHAFEPTPETYRILEQRFRKKPNVHCYMKGLGRKECSAFLRLHYGSGHNSLVFKGQDFSRRIVKIQIKTLDSFKFHNVGLIKIDTEGYEIPILEGAEETIKEWKPRLIIEVHGNYEEEQRRIFRILRSWQYAWIVQHKAKVGSQPHIIADSYSYRSTQIRGGANRFF